MEHNDISFLETTYIISIRVTLEVPNQLGIKHNQLGSIEGNHNSGYKMALVI